VLPDGMSYRLLVLPQIRSMTPQLLQKIRDLVEDGASVLGPRMQRAPGLTDYPNCDEQVSKLADQLWGVSTPVGQLEEHRFGKGRVFSGVGIENQTDLAQEAQNPLENAKWIWHNEGNPTLLAPVAKRYFRRIVEVNEGQKVESARIVMTADNAFEVWVNGQPAGGGEDHHQNYVLDVTPFLKTGENILAVAAENRRDRPNPAGLIGSLTIQFRDGQTLRVDTDREWASNATNPDSWTTSEMSLGGWGPALELGPLGTPPWDTVGGAVSPTFPDSALVTEVLTRMGVEPDFTCVGGLRYIHRKTGEMDLYFVANPQSVDVEAACTFRMTGKHPELWWPETGEQEPAPLFQEVGGVTQMPLVLGPSESVFVVFREKVGDRDSVQSITRNGEPVLSVVRRTPKVVVEKAAYGIPGDARRTRDVKSKVQELVDGGIYEFAVSRLAQGDDPAVGVVKTLTVDYSVEGRPASATAIDPNQISLSLPTAPKRAVEVQMDGEGRVIVVASQPGEYVLHTVAGKTLSAKVAELPSSLELGGSWEIRFPSNWGAPATTTLKRLISWTEHDDPGVKYFSGTATYSKTFDLPNDILDEARRCLLDLGEVHVMARVELNGEDLGVLWNPPYRLDVTRALKTGENTLEVQVTNLWINRMIGDEQLPEDSERNPNGTLKEWPAWLGEGKPSPTGRSTFTTWRLWPKDAPLQQSGLIGPVALEFKEVVPAIARNE
jgi:hypothetical protein